MEHKIIIIDDDKYNQMVLNYDTDIRNLVAYNYQGIVLYLQKVEHHHLATITQAQIVMIHDSYPDAELKEQVEAITRDNSIPLIKFSNGITASFKTHLNHTVKIELKKDRVYSNLEYFLADYLDNDFVPDFEKLINGNNYKVVKAILIREHLSKSLLIGYGKRLDTLIPENSEDEKKLLELFYLAYGEDYRKHFDELFESVNAGYEQVVSICRHLVSLIKFES